MGGLAIKTIINKEGERLSIEDKEHYTNEFYKLFPNELFPIVEIKEKSSFGDLDFIVENSNTNGEILIEKIQKHFANTYQGFVKNSNVYSVAIDNKQFDFTLIPGWEVMPALQYYNNNDFGNLVGRIANSIGLQFGHKGLFCPVFLEGQKHEEILLSTNIYDICYFLELDRMNINKYVTEGFDTYQQMYEYIINSKYFQGSNFQLDFLDQANRIRNKKRKTYKDFLEYLEKTGYNKKQSEFPLDKEYHRLRSLKNFGVETVYFETIMKIRTKQYESKIFNGEVVMRITGLTGKKLGEFIKSFKEEVLKDIRDATGDITCLSRSKIEMMIENYYRYKKQ